MIELTGYGTQAAEGKVPRYAKTATRFCAAVLREDWREAGRLLRRCSSLRGSSARWPKLSVGFARCCLLLIDLPSAGTHPGQRSEYGWKVQIAEAFERMAEEQS